MSTTRTPSAPPLVTVLRSDLPASLVVFLVAVPLSLGVVLASGAPLLAGLIAAVAGGVVAGLLGGSPLQVSGPAVGLTAVVADLVVRFGRPATVLITLGAGLVQIGFGLARVARFASAIPPAVVHGMLAGIGVTIALSHLHVVLGGTPRTSALDSAVALPAGLLALDGPALLVGLTTVGVVLAWPRLPGWLRAAPGPLVGVLVATALAGLWPDVPRVDLPGNLLDAVALPALSGVPDGQWLGIATGVRTVAVVASVESCSRPWPSTGCTTARAPTPTASCSARARPTACPGCSAACRSPGSSCGRA